MELEKMVCDAGWLIPDDGNAIIAGPCSAESEEQVLSTATQIAKNFPHNIFRAGVWKPRTRPGMFEGRGEQALQWLSKVKPLTGMRVATEVATTKHVEAALKYGVDVLWIGARSTGNPFHVQELADSLRGVDIPVLIKNPLHPDMHLWIGAIERFYKTGNRKLAAVHRGFHSFENSGYRNVPRWQLVHQFQKLLPQIPVICDISHIAGDRRYLSVIAQQAYDLKLSGLMVETHFNPSVALSDKQQQITPDELKHLLTSIDFNRKSFEDTPVMSEILSIRKRIDELDRLLLDTLQKRMEISKEIGEIKREYNVEILQLQRWKIVIDSAMQLAVEKGLNQEFIKNVLIQIHDESIRLQSEIMNELHSNNL